MKLYIPSVYHLHTPKKTETRGLHPNFGLVYTLNFKQLLRYKKYLKSVGLTIIKAHFDSGSYRVV